MNREGGGWLALAAVSLAVFVAALDLTVTTAVLPQLIFDFQIPLPEGLAHAAWIVNGYLIAYVVTMPLMGRVSDLYGRRLTFLACLGLFVAGSLWAGGADRLGPMVMRVVEPLWAGELEPWAGPLLSMVAARVVQALGGGAMVPVALAAVSDAVSLRHRPLALGIVAALDTAGWVAGPVYGAWLATSLGWRWIFWVNVPIGLVAALLVWLALRDHTRTRHQLDVVGAALLTLFLLAFTLALYRAAPAGAETGGLTTSSAPTASPWLWAFLASSLLALVGFILRQRRAREPLIDPLLLRGRTFAAANLVSLLTGVVLMGVMVEIPVLLAALSGSLQEGTAASGWLLALFAGGMVVGALAAGLLLRGLAARLVTLGGLLAMIAGLWQMAVWEQTSPPQALGFPLALAGLGIGLVTTPLSAAVLDRVAETQRGIAASLLLVARLLGMTLGLAVLVTWALRRYEALAAQVPPAPGGLLDPNAVTYYAEAAAQITTTVVTDLFLVTAIIGVAALLPALWLPMRRPAA